MSFKEFCFSHTQLCIFKGLQYRRKSHMINSFCLKPSPAKYKQDSIAAAQKSFNCLSHSTTSVLGRIWCPMRDSPVWMQGCDGIQMLYKTYLQYCVLQLEAALRKKIMQMYLLISTKINISVISIRISEDHYGSNLGLEIGALLAREFTSSVNKCSRLLLLVV